MQKYLHLVPNNLSLDFIGKFKYFIVFSILTLIAIVAGLWTKGLNYGIDFTGGTVMRVKFNQPHSSESVRKIMDELGETEASVVSLGETNQEFMITSRIVKDEKEQKNIVPINARFLSKVGANEVTVQSVDVVGPKVGAELKAAALRSLFYSVILITIYIWLRFDVRFAPGATLAMIHDLVMATGFYMLTGREFTITAIAALLTIAGYSVNDTIVVYDRVREMLKQSGSNLPLPQTINKAINLTLSRTVLTSLVTFISIVPIIFLCKGEIQSFAIAMCFGIFVGTYSTMYIASPFTIYVEKFLEARNGKSKSSRSASKPATV
ncbi:protein translocase subunit SecF [bacterium]|nr:protein translocase subunit SecF [bacterium]